jgi:hypothetical protein
MRYLRNNCTSHTWHLRSLNNHNRFNYAKKYYRLRMRESCKECFNRGRRSRA